MALLPKHCATVKKLTKHVSVSFLHVLLLGGLIMASTAIIAGCLPTSALIDDTNNLNDTTSPDSSDNKTVTDLVINGPDEVAQSDTGKYTASLTYSDNTSQDVTDQAKWSIASTSSTSSTSTAQTPTSSSTDLGTLSNGVYVAPSTVPADSVPVTITADYIQDGVAETATRTVSLVTKRKVSGQLFDSSGKEISGITVMCSYNNLTYVTDASGYFSFRVPFKSSGTIIPQSTQYTFTPAKITFTKITSDLPEQNFIATQGTAPANQAPTANSQTVTTQTNTSVSLTLTGTDPDGDSLTYAIATTPTHGTLTGTAPNVSYTPATNYTGTDTFTFKVNDGSLDSAPATVSIQVSDGSAPTPTPTPTDGSWTPPLGIPAPSFGINETVDMYKNQTYNYGNGLEAYRDAGNGPYTHYVNPSSPAATDTNNEFGTPAKPRKTPPNFQSLPAGSVVEIHGTIGYQMNIRANGTAAKPIFIRGANASTPFTLAANSNCQYFIGSSYVILENFIVNNNGSRGSMGVDTSHHIAIRNGEITNGRIGMMIYGDYYNMSSFPTHDIVVYNMKIHDNGVWDPTQATGDQDYHGIEVKFGTYNVWIVDNQLYHNSGDGVQINGQEAGADPSHTHHVYLGRNISHHNKQTGLWCKFAHDVIFSSNTVYGHRASSSAKGAGMGFQYDNYNMWFINNRIYDNECGIGCHSVSSTGGNGKYFIGNLIYNIHTTRSDDPTDSSQNGAAFVMWDYGEKWIINNTMYDCDGGIQQSNSPPLHIINNILMNIKSTDYAIMLYNSGMASSTEMHHNLIAGNFRIFWGGTTYTTLGSFQAGTGKGSGCLTSDPLFTNPTAGDFSLQTSSPAIDKGTISDVYATFKSLYGIDISKDINGTARPQGAGFDIGACER